MSRFLALLITAAKRCAARVIIILGLFCLLFGWFMLGGALLAIGVLNEIVRWKMKRQLAPFAARSLVRNVDYLIIGELCETANFIPGKCELLQLKIPGCSLDAAYEVLRHSFSIIKDNGGVAVLAYKNKRLLSHKYSLFDVNFYVPVTIQRLHLEIYKIMGYFPFLFSPLKSLRLMLNIKPASGGGIADCQRKDIISFCKERNIDLICIQY